MREEEEKYSNGNNSKPNIKQRPTTSTTSSSHSVFNDFLTSNEIDPPPSVKDRPWDILDEDTTLEDLVKVEENSVRI